MKSREEICHAINNAFGSTTLAAGFTLSQFEVLHLFSVSELAAIGRCDAEVHWLDIPDSRLENSYEILFCRDFNTWAFHLAAYLNWALRNSCSTLSPALDALVLCLTRRAGGMDNFDQLNTSQKQAIRYLLEYLAGNGSDTDAAKAIASYWHTTTTKG